MAVVCARAFVYVCVGVCVCVRVSKLVLPRLVVKNMSAKQQQEVN